MEMSGCPATRHEIIAGAASPAAAAIEPGATDFDPRDLIGGEREPDGLRRRQRINPLRRESARLLIPEGGAEGVADLVAMHAALHDLAIPVQVARDICRRARESRAAS